MNRTIISLIKKADLDLSASKVLFKKQDFSNSLFLFQQAVEKGYKAGGLLTRQISIDQLNLVGHNFLKMLKFTLSGVTSDGLALTANLRQELLGTDDYVENEFQNINPSDRHKFFDLNENEILDLLNQINSFKKNLKKILANPQGVSGILELAKQSGKLTEVEKSGIDSEDPNQIALSDTSKTSELLGQIFALQILGLITTAHSEQTRYPFTDKLSLSVKCPTEIYTADMPVIKNLKKFFKLADKAIFALKREMNMHSN